MMERFHRVIILAEFLTFLKKDENWLFVFTHSGHGSCPTEEQTAAFIRVVNAFTSAPNSARKLIAIHCTHGFNRTGSFCALFL